jgi:hypothetical protein
MMFATDRKKAQLRVRVNASEVLREDLRLEEELLRVAGADEQVFSTPTPYTLHPTPYTLHPHPHPHPHPNPHHNPDEQVLKPLWANVRKKLEALTGAGSFKYPVRDGVLLTVSCERDLLLLTRVWMKEMRGKGLEAVR